MDTLESRKASKPPPAEPTPLSAPAGAKPFDYNETLRSRGGHTKFADPCSLAREESMKCLDRNAYDRSKCTDFFQAYRDCKSTWLNQRREDRRAGKDVA
ncbi:Mitochondrial copper homeostasis protein [Rhodotorula kratochvilovae]